MNLTMGHTTKKIHVFCRQGRCLPPGLVDVTDCYYGEFSN